LRVGNVRQEGGIARRGASGLGSLRSGRVRGAGSGIEFTSMEKTPGMIGTDQYLQNS
jgi:hypothetical protein